MRLFGRSVIMGLGLALGFAVIAAAFMTGGELLAEQRAATTATALTVARATALEQQQRTGRATATAEAETARQADATNAAIVSGWRDQARALNRASDANATAFKVGLDATMRAITGR